MGSTSNYSWPTPEQTDLVKDGWDAIKDLGDAADTTVKAVADGRGLVHINTTSFSAVASQSFNNVFSSTYDNYRLVIYAIGTNFDAFNLRFRASGSDNSASTYQYQGVTFNGSSVTASRSTNQTSIRLADTATDNFIVVTDILSPNLAERTGGITQNIFRLSSNIESINRAFSFDNTTTFDGFSIIAATGTITGTISIYGYRKS